MKNSILSEIQFANIILETYNLKIEQNNLIYYISQNVLNINEQFKNNYEKVKCKIRKLNEFLFIFDNKNKADKENENKDVSKIHQEDLSDINQLNEKEKYYSDLEKNIMNKKNITMKTIMKNFIMNLIMREKK